MSGSGTEPDVARARLPRTRVVAVVVVAVAVLAAVVAVLVPRVGSGAERADQRGCTDAAAAPFGCDAYRFVHDPDVGADWAMLNALAWFDVDGDGGLLLTMNVGQRLVRVPVERTGNGGTSASTLDGRYADASCQDDECAFRSWLARSFAGPASFTPQDRGLVVEVAGKRLVLESTGQDPQWPAMATQEVGGRVLLRYVTTGDGHAAAYQGGVLGTNEHGCITGGNEVLVLPDSARLLEDGSVVVDGRRFAQGEPLSIGGGIGSLPRDTRCGLDVDYWWY